MREVKERENSTSIYVVNGLEVCDLSGTNIVKLQMVYTREEMPVSTKNVPRQAVVDRRPYLREIHIPDIDIEVELLTGTNAPTASENLLGWAIRGLLRKCKDNEHNTPYMYVNWCSVCSDKGLETQVDNYFKERSLDNKPEHSREDRIFMSMVTANIEQKEGHYQIALPFKQHGVNMPNNRPQAFLAIISCKMITKRG